MRTWETFVKVVSPLQVDRPPEIDAGWLMSKGIQPIAADVLRHVRKDVLPMLRENQCPWFCFLIHDRGSGVPTTEDDKAIYLHVRLGMLGNDPPILPAAFIMTREVDLSQKGIAGIDPAVFADEAAWEIIGAQFAWLAKIIEAIDGDDLAVLRHCRQFLHYFANALQMPVT